MTPYASPADQAWLRLWVGIYGNDSRLAKHLLPAPRRLVPSWIGGRPAVRPPIVPRAKPSARSAKPLKPREDRAERKLRGDIEKAAAVPVSDWAKRLMGDKRNHTITLQDILDGIEDYFEIFDNMRRIDPDAYSFFSRVGAPIITRNIGIWEDDFLNPKFSNAAKFPSYFGAFFPETKDEYRDGIVNDRSRMMSFNYFLKSKNPATIAPHGTAIYAHHQVFLKRDGLSKAELARFPYAKRDWSMWWYLGILPDGSVRALPHHMQHSQRLPSGDYVRHSAFHIPPGIAQIDKEGDPHRHVKLSFAAVVGFTAAAMAGVQVSVKRGRTAARFGVPITMARRFFADRDASDGARRRPILHLRAQHERRLPDGRLSLVGEHLSGQRQFAWRGFDVTIGVPGIDFPSPEGFDVPLYETEEDGRTLDRLPEGDTLSMRDTIGSAAVGDLMAGKIWANGRTRFKRGKPETTYAPNTLEPGSPAAP